MTDRPTTNDDHARPEGTPATGPAPAPRRAAAAAAPSLSYKFQRLREKLRAAVASGELSGKLPGERALAKRFHVNAKTLSKALTDLAAEGLLDRSIGRGTYVKGSRPEAATADRWLVVCDAGAEASALVKRLVAANPEATVITAEQVAAGLRPSFVNQFGAVINASAATPEGFVRDLLVRNIHVVAVGHQPATYSTDTVDVDRALAVACLARDLMLAGHRRFVAVEERNETTVSEGLRAAAFRYAPDAQVDRCFAAESAGAVEQNGASAVVCDGPAAASAACRKLADAGIDVPGRVSVTAVGCVDAADAAPCSGYFATVEQVVESVLGLLREKPARPVSLWLPARSIDAGTLQGSRAADGGSAPNRVLPLSA